MPQLYGEPEYLNLWRYIFNYKNYPYIGTVKSSKGFTCRQNKSKSFSPYFPPKANSWERAANHLSVAFRTFYCAPNVVGKALKSDCVGSDVSLSLSSHVTLDKFHHLSAPPFCHPSRGDNNGIYPIDSFRHKMSAWPLRSNKCLQKWGCDEGGIGRRNSLRGFVSRRWQSGRVSEFTGPPWVGLSSSDFLSPKAIVSSSAPVIRITLRTRAVRWGQ